MPIHADGALPNNIYIGSDPDSPIYAYSNDNLGIGSVKGTFNCDVISNELPIDTFSFSVYYDENQEKVYLTKDTKEIYVCRVSDDDPGPVVPGTLESIGWTRTRGGATVEDNTVTLPSGDLYKLVWIKPGGTNNFASGDIIRISVEVTSVTNEVDFHATRELISANVGTVTSETGLFDCRYGTNITMAKATSTGKDVLTFAFSVWASELVIACGSWQQDWGATLNITAIEFNNETIYGKERGGLIYLLSRSGVVPAKEYLKDIRYGTPVWWFCNDYLQGKGYLKTVERTGEKTWKLTCMSAIGLLDEKMHGGGMYTGQTFDEVMQDIVGSSFRYEYAPGDESIAELAVYGWLPYDTARNNMHRLLFAMGATIKRVDNQ